MTERWSEAVGEAIARQAWPSRIGRDGTVHVNTADAIWAFELTQQAREIARRLGVGAVRFTPGPLAGSREAEHETPAPAAVPSAAQLQAAAEIAAEISGEELRKSVQKAVALGLARGS